MNRKQKIHESPSRRIFVVANYLLLFLVTLTCVLPIVHILAVSFSSSTMASTGQVSFWPLQPTLAAYEYLVAKGDFFRSVGISAARVVVGTAIMMLLIFMSAYPLSKSSRDFRFRNAYMTYFAITMFLGGGMIPTYMVLRGLNLLNNFWVLILPCAVSVWSIIIMMNFMRGIPSALLEAAAVDGASQWRTLFQIVLPVSLASIASLTLFSMIFHWNSWFDGMFYMNDVNNYPMATYLATQIMSNNQNMTNMTPEQLAQMAKLSNKTIRSAQLFISIVPILIIYPLLQRYFITGIVVGSVKE